jgi:putative ABC transport system substrate-binding protein
MICTSKVGAVCINLGGTAGVCLVPCVETWSKAFLFSIKKRKRRFIMKKLSALFLAAVMMLSIAACGNKPVEETNENESDAKAYKIAIVKQMDHASLDEISNAIAAQLDAIAAEKNIEISYRVFSGQGDTTTLNQIGSQVIADGYDAIIPVATTAAQCMVTAAEESKTPVIYAAVSDPETAGLTGLDFVTGVSDALDTKLILDMMLAQNPNVKTVGLLYSMSEANSQTSIAQAKQYLDAEGIAYVEKTGSNNDEIFNAAVSIANQADAIFTPTDNVVMGAELTIAELFANAKVPHYAGADSFVRNGAFATCGVNYSDLGKRVAEIAVDVLETKEVPEYYTMEGGIITVNTETAATLGVDYSMFGDMGTLKEVVTTEE